MSNFSIEQQRAIALANARRRLAESTAAPTPSAAAPQQRDMATESIEDVGNTFAGIPARATIRAGMLLPDLANAAIAGPQYLYEGIAGKDRPDFQPYKPFYGSEDVIGGLDIYQPKTGSGMAVDMVADVLLGAKAGKSLRNKALKDAGVSTPSSVKSLDIIPEAQKAAKKLGKINPIDSGIKANQAISKQYDFDTTLQRQLYGDANNIGKIYSIETPQLYSKMDDIIGYLDGKIAVDTPEFRALTDLKDIRTGMQGKYTPPDAYDPAMLGMKAAPQTPKGIEPADLIEIKTTLNSGLKSNKLPTAGSSKIVELKKYVNQALKEASAANPEFGKALRLAEKQAAKVGLYKEDSLRQLWQPEDYLAFRSGGELPADTINRASQLLQNINTKATGKISSLSRILPREQAKEIVKEAFRYGKQKKPSMLKAGMQALSRQPVTAMRTAVESATTPAEMPLDDLAKYITRMQQNRYLKQPASNVTQNLGTAMGAQSILNAIYGGQQ